MASFSDKTTTALLVLGDNIINTIGTTGGAPWHVSEATITALGDADNDLTAAINAQGAAKMAEMTATKTKNGKKSAVVAMLNDLQTTLAANPAITDEMLASIGFSRRGSAKSKAMATGLVTGLTANPQTNNTVKLKWDRGDNAATTMFVVETSADGATWTMIKSVTRVSYTAEGFAPGVAAYFRVTATTSTSSGFPSLPVGIYLPATAAKVQLRVA